MLSMAAYWVQRGNRVSLITQDSSRRDRFQVPSGVRRVALDLTGSRGGIVLAPLRTYRRWRAVRREISVSRPDVIISFMARMNVLVLLAVRGMSIPLILAERTNPATSPLGQPWAYLRKRMYHRAKLLVCQTEREADWFNTLDPRIMTTTIPNPVTSTACDGRVRLVHLAGCKNHVRHVVLAVGRLVDEKGFDDLIQAFARAARDRTDWGLVIFGDGEKRQSLIKLAVDLDIADRVCMPGFVDQPERLMAQADIFVLSSKYEGFPNVLLEAMTAGLAVVSYDCSNGPAEIISHCRDGLLVPLGDVGQLASSIEQLMRDPARRKSYGEAALRKTIRFDPSRIMRQWDRIALVTTVSRPFKQ